MNNDHADTPGSVTPREYFAALAMQALLTRVSCNPYELARMSFEVADAMVETSAEKLGQP